MNTTIYASDYAKLDSNVYTGGGTDDTEVLQSLLDKALEWGRLKLVLDGAALVRGLKVHSNTTIECMNKGCGLYLADGANNAVLTNSNHSYKERNTKNVTLLGGTYNHNCLHQEHDVPVESAETNVIEGAQAKAPRRWVLAMEFVGIENLTVRDVTVRDQRTFAFTVGNFKHVTIENTFFELINEIPMGNQDGFHFWGPGQFLTMRNIGGKTEDDFMNIGPDERDGVSSITDVYIDGVFVDHAWQAIRLLSKGTGLLDRVTIRNVTGTYSDFGFYINPWFIDKTMGNFGNILFENIDLRPETPNTTEEYRRTHPAFLFSIGGDFESLTFKNISWYKSLDNRNVFQLGCPYHTPFLPYEFDKRPLIKNMLIDGLKIIEEDGSANDTEYITARGDIDRLTLRDIDIIRPESDKNSGCLLKTLDDADIHKITLDRADIENLNTVFDLENGKVDKVILNNIFTDNVKEIAKISKETKVIDLTK